MRVIRPAALARDARRRARYAPLALTASGVLGVVLAIVIGRGPGTGLLAIVGVGIAVGGALALLRTFRLAPRLAAASALERHIGSAFDDSYTLVLGPRLPGVGRGLHGVLVGPSGVRALTVRDWEGRYRVRGPVWEFHLGRDRWIRCRTNPNGDLRRLVDGLARFLDEAGATNPRLVSGAIVFPGRRSRVLLEEPAAEVVTPDNVPWWANAIGRVQRLSHTDASRVVEAVLEATEVAEERGRVPGPAVG